MLTVPAGLTLDLARCELENDSHFGLWMKVGRLFCIKPVVALQSQHDSVTVFIDDAIADTIPRPVLVVSETFAE